MDTGTTVLTAGVLSMLLMEFIKFVVRKIKKDSNFSLPSSVYWVGIPVLNLFTPYCLVWMGVSTTLPMEVFSLMGMVKLVVLTVVGSVVSYLSYTGGLKTLKEYTTEYKATMSATK